MATKQFAKCPAITVEGSEVYIIATMKHLEKIATIPLGKTLLNYIRNTGKSIKVVMTGTGGNSTSYQDSASPLLVQAINNQLAIPFRNELQVALNAAKRGGVGLEFIARQLTEGLTPVTYSGAKNVIQPPSKVKTPVGMSGAQVMALHANKAMQQMGWLQDFANGQLSVSQLPVPWKADLPRILRPWLTPGRGADSKISFDPGDWKPCALDPAMKGRHPSLGLAHEMIHAWHSASGRNMRVKIGNENLEEVITTGLPPYNFEDISDNKLRTEFGNDIQLRTRY